MTTTVAHADTVTMRLCYVEDLPCDAGDPPVDHLDVGREIVASITVTLNGRDSCGTYNSLQLELPTNDFYVKSTSQESAEWNPADCSSGTCIWTPPSLPLDLGDGDCEGRLSQVTATLRPRCWTQAPNSAASWQASLAYDHEIAGVGVEQTATQITEIDTGAANTVSLHGTSIYYPKQVDPRWVSGPAGPGLAFSFMTQSEFTGSWPLHSMTYQDVLGDKLYFVGIDHPPAAWQLTTPGAWSRDPGDRTITGVHATTVGSAPTTGACSGYAGGTPTILTRVFLPCADMPLADLSAPDVNMVGEAYGVEVGAEDEVCASDSDCDTVCDPEFTGTTNHLGHFRSAAPCECIASRCQRRWSLGQTNQPWSTAGTANCYSDTHAALHTKTPATQQVGLGGAQSHLLSLELPAGVTSATNAFISDRIPAGTTLNTLTKRDGDHEDWELYVCELPAVDTLDLATLQANLGAGGKCDLLNPASPFAPALHPNVQTPSHVAAWADLWGDPSDGRDGLGRFEAGLTAFVPASFATGGYPNPYINTSVYSVDSYNAYNASGEQVVITDSSGSADAEVTVVTEANPWPRPCEGDSRCLPVPGSTRSIPYNPDDTIDMTVTIFDYGNQGAVTINPTISLEIIDPLSGDAHPGAQVVGVGSAVRPGYGAPANVPVVGPSNPGDALFWAFGDTTTPLTMATVLWVGHVSAHVQVWLDPAWPWLDGDQVGVRAVVDALNNDAPCDFSGCQPETREYAWTVTVPPAARATFEPLCVPESQGEPWVQITVENSGGVDLTSNIVRLAMPYDGDAAGSTGTTQYVEVADLDPALGASVSLVDGVVEVTFPTLVARTQTQFTVRTLASTSSGQLQFTGSVSNAQLDTLQVPALGFEIGACTGTVTVTKFWDHDQDGVRDAVGVEPLLDGWQFEVRDSSAALVDTLTTGADGAGQARIELSPGDYTFTELLPAPSAERSWSEPVGGLERAVTVAPASATGLDFGNFCTCVDDPTGGCTTATCQPDGSCLTEQAAVGSTCSDGVDCTIGDACDAEGVCVAGTLADCDDSDPCTDAGCTAEGCVYTPNFPSMVPCGVGDCAQIFGVQSCDSQTGELSDTCDALIPDDLVEVCDSADNDCDGIVDNFFEPGCAEDVFYGIVQNTAGQDVGTIRCVLSATGVACEPTPGDPTRLKIIPALLCPGQ